MRVPSILYARNKFPVSLPSPLGFYVPSKLLIVAPKIGVKIYKQSNYNETQIEYEAQYSLKNSKKSILKYV